MKQRYLLPAILLCVALAGAVPAHSQQLGYRAHDGEWRVIDAADYPRARAVLPRARMTSSKTDIAFSVTYLDVDQQTGIGFDDPVAGLQRQQLVMHVIDYIDDVLNESGACDIEFQVSQVDGYGALGTGGTFFFVSAGFQNGLSFRHIRTGIDPSGNVPDIQVTIDFGYNYNETLEPSLPGQIDLYTVLLHELTHGLHFQTLAGEDGLGSLTGYPNTYAEYDRYLRTGNGKQLFIDPGQFNGVPGDLTGGDGGVIFYAAAVLAAYGGAPVPIYAPSAFASGSSLSHFDGDAATGDPVMGPRVLSGPANRKYEPYEIAALVDIGYTNAAPVAPADTATPTDTPIYTGTPTATETPVTPTPSMPEDVNGDGIVDAKDLLLLLDKWHQ